MKMINNIHSQLSLSLWQVTRRAAVMLAIFGVFAFTTTVIPVSDANAQTQNTCPSGEVENAAGVCDCIPTEFRNTLGNCQACPLDQVVNADGTGCDKCEDFGQTVSDDNSACECPAGYARDGNNEKEIDGVYQNAVGCVPVPNNIDNAEECDQTGTIYTGHGGPVCHTDGKRRALTDYPHSVYNQTNCEAQEGRVFSVIDNLGNVGEFCQVQTCIVADIDNPDTCNNPSPNRANPRVGDSYSSCLMRAHEGFQHDDQEESRVPDCRTLFGTNVGANVGEVGFPNLNGNVNVQRRGATSLTDTTPFPARRGSGASAETIRIGVAAAVGIGVLLYAGGNTDSFQLVPHAKLHHKNGVSYYDYGSRLEFQQDNIEVQWTAARAHGKGTAEEWTYGTNAKWTGDVFAASLINQSSGLDSDTTFSLSARRQFGVWTLHSGANADWNVSQLNTEWKSGMSIGADVVYNKWTIQPLAKFSWHDADSQNNTQFQVNLQHDL